MRHGAAAFLAAALWAGAASAQVWDQHERLICTGERFLTCDNTTGACEVTESGALFRVDFTRGEVFTHNAQEPERVVGRAHFASRSGLFDTQSTIYLSGIGRVMSFAAPDGEGRIRATMIGAGVAETLVHTLRCEAN